MMKKIFATTIIAGAALSFTAAAQAQQSDFNAKPMNSGAPMMMMPGMQPAAEPMAAPPGDRPMMNKMSKRKMMMKKKMMMKQQGAM